MMVSIGEALDGRRVRAHCTPMLNLVTTLLDPVIIAGMLGLAALFRGSIMALVGGALALVGASYALGSGVHPAAAIGAAVVWGIVGRSLFKKRPEVLLGGDAVDNLLDAG